MRAAFFCLVLLFTSVFAPIRSNSEETAEPEETQETRELYEGIVTRVLDADTVEIDGMRVHLLGADSPERWWWGEPRDCYAEESAKFLNEAVFDKVVQYAFDKDHGRHGHRGKKSVYLYLDERFINAELIENGYAFADRSKRYAEREGFLELEAKAKLRGRGLWGMCPTECYGGRFCRTKNW